MWRVLRAAVFMRCMSGQILIKSMVVTCILYHLSLSIIFRTRRFVHCRFSNPYWTILSGFADKFEFFAQKNHPRLFQMPTRNHSNLTDIPRQKPVANDQNRWRQQDDRQDDGKIIQIWKLVSAGTWRQHLLVFLGRKKCAQSNFFGHLAKPGKVCPTRAGRKPSGTLKFQACRLFSLVNTQSASRAYLSSYDFLYLWECANHYLRENTLATTFLPFNMFQ